LWFLYILCRKHDDSTFYEIINSNSHCKSLIQNLQFERGFATFLNMPEVIVTRSDYTYRSLKPAVFEMMESLLKERISRQSKVLIKPNLLLPARADRAVLTHPLVVRAVAEYVIEQGAHPQISDSPAVGSFRRILKTGGYKKAFDGMNVTFKSFNESVKVDIGPPFGRIDMAREAVDVDMVINLAKLKTHSQMLMTLGVKNLFGCIVGLKKPEWHLKSGENREVFARLLVQVHRAVNPVVTIVDGILALEGQGPGKGGTPRHLGVLVGSRDAFAADMAICSMLGLAYEEVPTLAAAKEMGITGGHVTITGDFPMIDNFRFPEPMGIMTGPRPLRRYMRKYILQRPAVDRTRCRMCDECRRYCPAAAITHIDDRLRFDYDRCIRCYCCVEVCPHGAMQTMEPMPGKILRRAGRIRQRIRSSFT